MNSRRNLRERAWVSAKLGLDPIHQSRESRTRAGIADASFPSGVSVQLRHQPWQIFHQLPPLLRRKRTDGLFDFLKRVHGAKPPRNRQARKAAHRDSNLSGRGLAERVAVLRASHNLLVVLGLRPVLGRGFAAEEDQPGGAPVALLGQAAWHRLFGGRDDALGQVVQLDGEPFTVIGVLPPEAAFPRRDDLWVPLAMSPTDGEFGWFLRGIGRLKTGVSIDQARADLLRIHKNLADTRKVNEILARLYWPGQDALGKRIRQHENAPWLEVVGVVHDVKHYGVGEPMRPGQRMRHKRPLSHGKPPVLPFRLPQRVGRCVM